MSSSSTLPNKFMRTRSLLQICAANHKHTTPISFTSGNGGDRRNYRLWRSSNENAFAMTQQLHQLFCSKNRHSENIKQQTQQLMLKRHYDRQRGFSSSSAAAQESSSSSESEQNEKKKGNSDICGRCKIS